MGVDETAAGRRSIQLNMNRILVADKLAEEGLQRLRSAQGVEFDVRTGLAPAELAGVVGDFDGMIIRSGVQVTAECFENCGRLRAIARAGVGVDNIDLDAATQRGVIVVNAPLGNTISAAEHSIALMLALARRLPEAYTSLRAGRWERQKFVGVEVRAKTLGVVGLGQVGSEVARRGRAMEMRVIAADPYVAAERASSLGVELVSLDELLEQADFISLHVSLTATNRDLLGDEQLNKVKPGVRIINTARGELIDEEALVRALDDGRVAGAAIDVFREEPPVDSPLLTHDRIIVTPHLGALTPEAQERVAVDVAEQVLAILRGEPARYAVNAPLVSPETMKVLRPFLEVAEQAASLATQLCDGQLKGVELEFQGEIANHDVAPLKAAAIKGLLAPISEEHVSIVNADLIAEQRGMRITERKSPAEDYPNLVLVRLDAEHGTTTVAGTVFHDVSHIVRVNDFLVDIPHRDGYLLFCENVDRPGMVGVLGTLLGDHNINISFMRVSPEQVEGKALMVLGLDGEIGPELLRELEALPDLFSARLAKL